MSSLRRKKNDFRVVLHKEPKFDNGTFILTDQGVNKGKDQKVKDYFSLEVWFTFLTMEVTNHLYYFSKVVMVLLPLGFLQISVFLEIHSYPKRNKIRKHL